MKKTVLLIVGILCTINLIAQHRGTMHESYTTDTSKDYRSVSYIRELGIGTTSSYGSFYRTEYHVFDHTGIQMLLINLAHYKKQGEIEIYIFPFHNGRRMDSMLQAYIINPSDFIGLKYEEASKNSPKSYNKDGSEKRRVGIRFFSNKKEHLLLEEIDSKLFNFHYKVIN